VFQGVKDVYFVFTEADDTEADGVYFDSWQFTEAETDGIMSFSADTSSSTSQLYDVTGRHLPAAGQQNPIMIEQYVDQQGVQRVRKHIAPIR